MTAAAGDPHCRLLCLVVMFVFSLYTQEDCAMQTMSFVSHSVFDLRCSVAGPGLSAASVVASLTSLEEYIETFSMHCDNFTMQSSN